MVLSELFESLRCLEILFALSLTLLVLFGFFHALFVFIHEFEPFSVYGILRFVGLILRALAPNYYPYNGNEQKNLYQFPNASLCFRL